MNHDKLNAYNVVWNTPSADSSGSMPLGNGDIGLNVWVEQNGDLLFYISKSDAWNENARLLKLGRVRVSVSFSPNPFVQGTTFQQTLKLLEGEIEIIAGQPDSSFIIRIWVDANQPVINVETNSGHAIEVHVTLECWRTQFRELTGAETASAYGLHGGPNPIIESPDTILDESKTDSRIIWFHRNPTSIWSDNLELQGLGNMVEKSTDPLLNNTFGAVIQGIGFTLENDSSLVSQQHCDRHLIRIYPYTQQTSGVEGWIAGVEAHIGRIEGTNLGSGLIGVHFRHDLLPLWK